MATTSCAELNGLGPARGFAPWQRRVVRAFAEALLSDIDKHGHAVAPAPQLVDGAVDRLERWLGAGSPELQRGYRLLCAALQSLPPVAIGTMCRRTRLALAERVVYLDALERSRTGWLSTMLMGLKLPLGMVAFETTEELRRMGVDRESLTEPRGPSPIAQPQPWAGT